MKQFKVYVSTDKDAQIKMKNKLIELGYVFINNSLQDVPYNFIITNENGTMYGYYDKAYEYEYDLKIPEVSYDEVMDMKNDIKFKDEDEDDEDYYLVDEEYIKYINYILDSIGIGNYTDTKPDDVKIESPKLISEEELIYSYKYTNPEFVELFGEDVILEYTTYDKIPVGDKFFIIPEEALNENYLITILNIKDEYFLNLSNYAYKGKSVYYNYQYISRVKHDSEKHIIAIPTYVNKTNSLFYNKTLTPVFHVIKKDDKVLDKETKNKKAEFYKYKLNDDRNTLSLLEVYGKEVIYELCKFGELREGDNFYIPYKGFCVEHNLKMWDYINKNLESNSNDINHIDIISNYGIKHNKDLFSMYYEESSGRILITRKQSINSISNKYIFEKGYDTPVYRIIKKYQFYDKIN